MADAVAADGNLGVDIGAPSKRRGMKKLLLFVILPVLLLGGAAVGLVVSGIFNPFAEAAPDEEHAAETHADPKQLVFHDLPEMLVNLNAAGKRPTYLKIRVSLELAKAEDAAHLQALAPRIVDNFQIYLRELRVTDLRGSAGMVRLREELLRRVNAAIEPLKVRDVLFREMLVQ